MHLRGTAASIRIVEKSFSCDNSFGEVGVQFCVFVFSYIYQVFLWMYYVAIPTICFVCGARIRFSGCLIWDVGEVDQVVMLV